MPNWLLMILINGLLVFTIYFFDKTIINRLVGKYQKKWQIGLLNFLSILLIGSAAVFFFDMALVWPFMIFLVLRALVLLAYKGFYEINFNWDFAIRGEDVPLMLKKIKLNKSTKEAIGFLLADPALKDCYLQFSFGAIFCGISFKITPLDREQYHLQMNFNTERLPLPDEAMKSVFLDCLKKFFGLESITLTQLNLVAEEFHPAYKSIALTVDRKNIDWNIIAALPIDSNKLKMFYFKKSRCLDKDSFSEQARLNTNFDDEIAEMRQSDNSIEISLRMQKYFDGVYDLAKSAAERLKHLSINIVCRGENINDWEVFTSWRGSPGIKKGNLKFAKIKKTLNPEPAKWQNLRAVFHQADNVEKLVEAVKMYNEKVATDHFAEARIGQHFLTVNDGQPIFDKSLDRCYVCGKELPENLPILQKRVGINAGSPFGTVVNFVCCCGSDKCQEVLAKVSCRNRGLSRKLNSMTMEMLGGIAKKVEAKERANSK
ncbi:MAG: hypothetical protein WCT18_01245 [Patescibacteria group bacterium]